MKSRYRPGTDEPPAVMDRRRFLGRAALAVAGGVPAGGMPRRDR